MVRIMSQGQDQDQGSKVGAVYSASARVQGQGQDQKSKIRAISSDEV